MEITRKFALGRVAQGNRRSPFFIWLFCAVLAALPLRAQTVGLAGEGYGATEIKTIAQHVLDRELSSVTYEICGDFLPAEEFERFQVVVLAGSHSERAYSAEDIEKICDFIEKGGRLLLIHQAPKMFAKESGNRRADFTFGRSYYQRDNPECLVNQPGSPLLAGAFDVTPHPFWLRANVLLKSLEWNNLIGTEEFILVGHRTLGQGQLYYAGSELFRILKGAKDIQEPDVADGWIQILKNIFTDASRGQ